MLRYPLDPVYSRILVASFDLACPLEIIDVLSLAVSGPLFIDRADTRDAAFAARTKFVHRDGDHLTALNVFRAYNDLVDQPKGSEAYIAVGGVVGWCRDNFVNSKTLAASRKVRDQLRELVSRDGQDWSVSCGTDYDLVLRCLVQGLYMNTALVQPDGSYKQTVGSLVGLTTPELTLVPQDPPVVYPDEQKGSSDYLRRIGECTSSVADIRPSPRASTHATFRLFSRPGWPKSLSSIRKRWRSSVEARARSFESDVAIL